MYTTTIRCKKSTYLLIYLLITSGLVVHWRYLFSHDMMMDGGGERVPVFWSMHACMVEPGWSLDGWRLEAGEATLAALRCAG